MTAPQSPGDEDSSTSEDRFARQDFRRYSHWSSAVAIIAVVIVIAVVFVCLAMLR
jgi:hypothetical protein